MKNLKEWCMENNELNLLEMYENGENKYSSDEIGFSSSKKVNFKCKKCGLKWQQSLNKMSKRKNKECPYCLHHKVSYMYNFEKEYPELAKEWNYERNEKRPNEYLPSSEEKVWWKCEKGHEWEAPINIRNRGTGCPYCKHVKTSIENSLAQKGKKRLLEEWNYDKNINITPEKISVSSGKKVWWKCKKGHEWYASVYNRNRGNNCPICRK